MKVFHYNTGHPYRPLRAMASVVHPVACSPLSLPATWPELWTQVQARLHTAGYRRGSLCLYRQVLRTMSRCFSKPTGLTTEQIRDYLYTIHHQGASASWLMANISVIRTVFDKLARKGIATRFQTPRRGHPLPHILTPDEVAHLLQSAPTLRDQLLLGFLYGSGLKVLEVCSLRWGDVNLERGILRVPGNARFPGREVPFASALQRLLSEGVWRCEPASFIFPGRHAGHRLSCRAAEAICKNAALAAGLSSTVGCMTLRHTFAVECLRAGMNIRELQVRLGHVQVETTLRYARMIPPPAQSPLDQHVTQFKREKEPDRPMESTQSPVLPEELLPDLSSLALPFPPDATDGWTPRFQAFLRTHIKDRFLALRRFVTRKPPV